MMTKPELGWALVDADTGKLIVLDGHIPIYWRRAVAETEAHERGLTTTGRNPDVRICRVTIAQYAGTRR